MEEAMKAIDKACSETTHCLYSNAVRSNADVRLHVTVA